MTKQQWVENNNSFYHVTLTKHVQDILENGLKRMTNPNGICVIRSCHPDVITYLIHMMLWTGDETNFSIIEISPIKHKLSPAEIIDDHVVEATNPIHNYIKRNILLISNEDIIGSHEVVPNIITDFEDFANNLRNKGLIEGFT